MSDPIQPDRPGDGDPPPILVRITTVSPIAGSLAGGFVVTLTGSGFQPDADVYFGNSPSPEVHVLSGTSIQATVPAATQTGSVNITVFNPDGSQGTKLAAFTYVSTQQPTTHAEVLGVSPLSVIEDTETDVTINGRHLIDAYNNGVFALRAPSRVSVEVLGTRSNHDADTGLDTFVFTIHAVASPMLDTLERVAIQVVASLRAEAANDGVFESSRQMFTLLPRSRPVPLAYSADLKPGQASLVVVAGRNLEGCTLDLGDGATVHLQRSEDRIVSGVVSVPADSFTSTSPRLSFRDADGIEMAQYSMWAAPAEDTAEVGGGDESEGTGDGGTRLMLTPVPGQQFFGPTAGDSMLLPLNAIRPSDLFFDWSNFEITVFQRLILISLIHEVHLIPFFDGGSGEDLTSDSPVLAQVGRLFRLRGVGILVALHVDIVISIRLVIIFAYRFTIWDQGLFNEFSEFASWGLGSVVLDFFFEVEGFLILSFLLAAVLPDGQLNVFFHQLLTITVDFQLSSDRLSLRFGANSHYRVNVSRIGPFGGFLPCDGRFQLASENGQSVFPDQFGGHHSFYFPRSTGQCCVPWDFDLQLLQFGSGQPDVTLQSSFRADFCLNALSNPNPMDVLIVSTRTPNGYPPPLELEVGESDFLRAMARPVDEVGNPIPGPRRDLRLLGFHVEFFLASSGSTVLDPGSLPDGSAFAVLPGDNTIRVAASAPPRVIDEETGQEIPFGFLPSSVLGFSILSFLSRALLPAINAGGLPVIVKGTITVELTVAYRDEKNLLVEAPAAGQQQTGVVTREVERFEPFEKPREYVLAARISVPSNVSAGQTLTFTVDNTGMIAGAGNKPLDIRFGSFNASIGFAGGRESAFEPERFFTGNLAHKTQTATLKLTTRPNPNDLIEVPGLTCHPNNDEDTGKLVPPGSNVGNKDVMLSATVTVKSDKATVSQPTTELRLAVRNDETFEEYMRVFSEVKSLMAGTNSTLTKMRTFAETFYNELTATKPVAAPSDSKLESKGDELWVLANDLVQKDKLKDDRPLYWARLQTIAALRSYYRRNMLGQPNIKAFELPSRGLTMANGRISFDKAPLNARKVIVTGFDPFELPFHPDQSNPSGLVALELNATLVEQLQPPAYVRAAVFPVRYADFDGGMVESAVRPNLGLIVLLMTCSRNGSDYYDVERFACRFRLQETPDNDLKTAGAAVPGTQEFFESTLPYERVITADLTTRRLAGPNHADTPFVTDQSYKTTSGSGIRPRGPNRTATVMPGSFRPEPIDEGSVRENAAWMKQPDAPTGTSLEGSGGSYLSNEIFYRTARERDAVRPSLASGHFHLPYVNPANILIWDRMGLINGVKEALRRFLLDRFRLRSSGDITFPRTNVNTTSAPITLTAFYDQNTNNDTINAFSVDVSPPFAVQWPGPTPIPLRPGSSLLLPFTFSPTTPGVQTQTISLLDQNGEVLLTAKLTGEGLPTYSISGQVTAGGVPLQGVLLTLNGTHPDSATTGTDGRYAFTGLDAGGSYTVTPSKTNYDFTPPSLSFTSLAANQSANFTATRRRRRISGHVRTAAGLPIPGATVTISGEATGTATTDVTGVYLFSELPEGGDYTVTASRVNYAFSLVSQVFYNLVADVDFDFMGAPVSYTISGRITSSGAGLGGVAVALSGSQNSSTTTDAAGNYSFTVTAEGSYTITPSKTNYTFSPTSASFSNIGANQIANFSATLKVYRIGGRVTTSGGAALSGVTVKLSGSQTATATTDATGNYSFANLPAGGSYTVTPSRTNYAFTPVARTFNDLNADQTSDFTGALVNYSISGRVTAAGVGLAGVTVVLSGSQTMSTTTDSTGNYSFTVTAEGNYTVTPSKAHYTFAPQSATFNNLGASQAADFSATLNHHTISGRVTAAGGAPLPNVALTLSGSQSATAVTDASGNYSFTNLPAGGNYTVTVARANYTFAPGPQSFSDLGADRTADFTGSLVSYAITGRVTNGGVGLAGVTVTLSGSQSSSTTTDAAGNYSFTATAEGNYTVTPSKANYTFTPQSAVFSSLGANHSADFSATLNRHNINGSVTTASGGAIPNVTLSLSGSQSSSTTSDASGNYSFTNLPAGSDYTVTPSRPNYSFSPASQSFSGLAANQTATFTATLVSYTLSGKVTVGGAGLAGVTVSLAGSQTATTTTDAAGNYSFTVTAEGDYMVTPSKRHYDFSPQSSSVFNLGANHVADFDATLERHTISGRVMTAEGIGLGGVAVALSGSQNSSTTTDASGDYSFANLPAGGDYTITPSRANYVFTPDSRSISDLSADQTSDFDGVPVKYLISGRVTSGGIGLGGVMLSLSGPQNADAITDDAGDYSFLVPALSSYTVTPSERHHTFTPEAVSFSNLSANQGADFAATLNHHTVSGRVTSASGTGIPGVTVELSGSQSGTSTTDADGHYSFANLPAGGSYTVTASRANYTFTDAQSFNDLSDDQTSDFIGALVSYTISGRVTSGGDGLAGIVVKLGGDGTATATTNADGNYSFAVTAEGDYTVSPSEHYAFTPPSANFSNLGANQIANFSAGATRHSIGGRVTNPVGDPLPNVTLILSGSRNVTAQTDDNGNYSFGNLQEGDNYVVTLRLLGYAFNPLGQTFYGLSADGVTDFAASAVGGVRINMALPSGEAVFSVSTMYRLSGGSRAVINGDIRSIRWREAPPDGSIGWLDVSFTEEKKISEIHVVSTEEGSAALAEVIEALPFTEHGLQDFDVRYWTDEGWKLLPGGAVISNEKVWVKLAFPPLRTARIRLVVRSVLDADILPMEPDPRV